MIYEVDIANKDNIFCAELVHILKFRLKVGIVKYIEFTVASNSMAPKICRGDQVKIVHERNYKEGDIIAYSHWDKSITIHRIIRIVGNRIYTKGDNNLDVDNYYITSNQIIGKMEE